MAVLPVPLLPVASTDPLVAPALVPRDMPRAHASGHAPFRLLVAGGRAVEGHGVLSHDLALAGNLARGVSERTTHGADVDLVVGRRVGPAEAALLLRDRDLARLDGLVVVLDAPRGRMSAASVTAATRDLLVGLADRLPPSSPIVVAVALAPGDWPPFGFRRSDERLRSFSAAVLAGAGTARFVELPALPSSHPAAAYRMWGGLLAGALSRRLRDPNRWRAPYEDLDESKRQAAVARLGELDGRWGAEFGPIVSHARAAYGTRFAALALLDRSRCTFVARRGFTLAELPREQSLADLVLRARGGLVVQDVREDPRFRDHLPVREGAIGFYAGYRVEGPDGLPVAALSVFDPQPRAVPERELTLLRDLALAAQRRMWELTPATR
jgi:hypothetical protein